MVMAERQSSDSLCERGGRITSGAIHTSLGTMYVYLPVDANSRWKGKGRKRPKHGMSTIPEGRMVGTLVLLWHSHLLWKHAANGFGILPPGVPLIALKQRDAHKKRQYPSHSTDPNRQRKHCEE